MTTRYPCPWCRAKEIAQSGLRVARIHVDPSTVGMLQCPEHWHYVARHSEPFEHHSVPFVLEQPNAAEALNRIMNEWELFELSTTEQVERSRLHSLFVVLRSVARERGFSGEDGGTR